MPWGEKAFSRYLGADRAAWSAHDANALMRRAHTPYPDSIRVDQGLADTFLDVQLRPETFEQTCATAAQPLTLRRHAGFNYAKAGVMRVDLRPPGQQQGELDLFGTGAENSGAASENPSRLMDAVDTLNRRFGRGSVTVASAQHQGRNGQHAGKQERRSPRCTTRLDEIVTVRT